MKTIAILAISIAASFAAWAQDVVLARNGWTTVTKADFEAEIARIPKEQQFEYLASAERIARTVEGILVNKTLAAQARAAGMHENAAIKAEMVVAADKVLARHRAEFLEEQLKVPDFTKRAEELYKSDPKKYSEKDLVHAKHILVDTRCRTADAARARALEARAELESGKSFAETAKKYSDDQSVARNGGDLGPMSIDTLSPPFAEATQAMKPGELSQPVLTNFGYHIIKLESLRKGRQYTFNEVRDSIIIDVKADWLKQQRKAAYESITADPKLKLDENAIQALKTNINAPAPQPKRPG
jgi:peptidyl-prolyl cis-trans isomerase C